MKIIADTNIPLVSEAFAEFGSVHAVPGRAMSADICKDADILLVRSVTPVNESLLAGSSIRFVGTATIGTDHVDAAYLKAQDIGFASAPGSNANSVAEYVTAALCRLAQKKKIRLQDLVLGIVGVGNVGKAVKAKAEAMGIPCLLNDPPLKEQTGDNRYIGLDELLEQADVVTVHVPLTKGGPHKTIGLAGNDFYRRMKKGAVFINSSRGKVVNEAALLTAVSEKLGALVLDVWATEPAINLDLLAAADIVTPHIAGYSYDGKIAGTTMLYQAACTFFNTPQRWSKDRKNDQDEKILIDCQSLHDPLLDAVLTAYPVARDDAALREISRLPSGEQGAYFEQLRKNYPKRLEFAHYAVSAETLDEQTKDVFSRLGFGIGLNG